MPNKDRNKRSVRKARQAERNRIEEARAASEAGAIKAAKGGKASKGRKGGKAAKAAKQAKTKSIRKTSEKTGPLSRIITYFTDVRTELRRVTWPSKAELRDYSVAVIMMLIVFGICVYLVDMGFVALLVGFTGLRG